MRLASRASLLALAMLALASTGMAQTRLAALTIGFTNEPLQTLAMSAIYTHPVQFLRLLGAVDVFVPEADDRYYRDTFSNGQSRCRDSVTGQFASDSKCGAALAFGAIRAEVLLPVLDTGIEIGPGFRVGERSLPHAAIAYNTQIERDQPFLLYLHGAGGVNFMQADVGIAMRF
jgi:hypothetical protein